MSRRLQRHASTLNLLAKAKPKLASGIIKNSSEDFIKCLCECCLNLLKGNIPISQGQKKKLKKYKNPVRNLAKKSVSIKHKRKIVQRGGFLGTLLSTIIPAIAGLVGGLVKK